MDARNLPDATPTPIPVEIPETSPAEVAPASPTGPIDNTPGATDPVLVVTAPPIRPKEEIERDIDTVLKALEQGRLSILILKAQHQTLGDQFTKANARVEELTTAFGEKPTDVQKAQLAEAKVAADRIQADYEAAGSAIVRAFKSQDALEAMLRALGQELNRKID